MMENLIPSLEDFIWDFLSWQEEHLEIVNEFLGTVDFQRFESKPKELIEFMTKEELKIYVIGSTSSGKSLYINTLFCKNILKSAEGHTTPCFVDISITEDSQSSYEFEDGTKYIVDFSKPEERRAFHDKIDNIRSKAVHTPVKLHLSSQIFDGNKIENVTIVDCPGMERSVFKEEAARMVESADALVLFVNVVSGQNEEANKRILYDCDFFVKPNVIVLFNKTDALMIGSDEVVDEDYDPDRSYELIKQSTEEMIEFLTRPGGPYKNEDDARNAIFFISAKEQRKRQLQCNESANSSLINITCSGLDAETKEKSFGYRATDQGFTIDSESLSTAYTDSLRSLLLIARDQKHEKKMLRLEREIDECKEQMKSTANDVEKQLFEVETNINTCIGMLREVECRGDSDDICSIFADHFYSEITTKDETEMQGGEKLRRFIDCLCCNKKWLKSAMLPQSKTKGINQGLKSILTQIFENVFDEIFELERSRSDDEFAERLDPPEAALRELKAELQEIEDDCNKKFRERINTQLEYFLTRKTDLEEEERREFNEIRDRKKRKLEYLIQEAESSEQNRSRITREIEMDVMKLEERFSVQEELLAKIQKLKDDSRGLKRQIRDCHIVLGVAGGLAPMFFISVPLLLGGVVALGLYKNKEETVKQSLKSMETDYEYGDWVKEEIERRLQRLQEEQAETERKLKEARDTLDWEIQKEQDSPPSTSSLRKYIVEVEERIQKLQKCNTDEELIRETEPRKLMAQKRYKKQLLEKKREHRTALKEFMRHLMDRISAEFDSRLDNKMGDLKDAREALKVVMHQT